MKAEYWNGMPVEYRLLRSSVEGAKGLVVDDEVVGFVRRERTKSNGLRWRLLDMFGNPVGDALYHSVPDLIYYETPGAEWLRKLGGEAA